MTKPIRPEEIGEAQAQAIPDFVFDVVNKLIATSYSHGSATLLQDAIVDAIVKVNPATTKRGDVFAKGWLNFEEAYRAAGWAVEYDKPGYNETYPASFRFSKRRA